RHACAVPVRTQSGLACLLRSDPGSGRTDAAQNLRHAGCRKDPGPGLPLSVPGPRLRGKARQRISGDRSALESDDLTGRLDDARPPEGGLFCSTGCKWCVAHHGTAASAPVDPRCGRAARLRVVDASVIPSIPIRQYQSADAVAYREDRRSHDSGRPGGKGNAWNAIVLNPIGASAFGHIWSVPAPPHLKCSVVSAAGRAIDTGKAIMTDLCWTGLRGEAVVVYKAVVVFGILLGLGAAADAQIKLPLPLPNFEGTPEEQAACRPDSQRFCKEAMPDSFLVLACLQKNRQRISVACQKVLQSHGQERGTVWSGGLAAPALG